MVCMSPRELDIDGLEFVEAAHVHAYMRPIGGAHPLLENVLADCEHQPNHASARVSSASRAEHSI